VGFKQIEINFMNQTLLTDREYAYTDSRSGHHHSYIAQPILDLIQSATSQNDLPPP
jgi:hypothetical protein